MTKKWIKDQSEIEAILNDGVFGAFATINNDGSPYVITVNYVYHNGKIYFHCALKGKKLDNINHDPRVCFEVHLIDRIVIAEKADEVSVRYRSVIVNGYAKIIDDTKLKEEALIALSEKYTKGHDISPPSPECIQHTGIVEIDIKEITGKCNID
ncbi:TPA: pyridoxamine 5'-phosphate oxidase family protein [bacterium]|nr:pyridoxamine 5'-phosphate oxidase family protein [bacterium]